MIVRTLLYFHAFRFTLRSERMLWRVIEREEANEMFDLHWFPASGAKSPPNEVVNVLDILRQAILVSVSTINQVYECHDAYLAVVVVEQCGPAGLRPIRRAIRGAVVIQRSPPDTARIRRAQGVFKHTACPRKTENVLRMQGTEYLTKGQSPKVP